MKLGDQGPPEETEDRFSMPLIITIVCMASFLLLVAALYGCCHQRLSQRKDQVRTWLPQQGGRPVLQMPSPRHSRITGRPGTPSDRQRRPLQELPSTMGDPGLWVRKTG